LKYRVVAAAALALLGFGTAAQAEDCKLVRTASIDLINTPKGQVTVNVTIGGTDYPFLLSTASIISSIRQSMYDKWRWPSVSTSGMYFGNVELKTVAMVPELVLGGLKGKDQQFYVAPDDDFPSAAVGEIGLDKLEAYDVELDLTHQKLNLFSPAHCRGQVIYWTATAAAAPFVMQSRRRQIMIPMTLDGAALNVLLNTKYIDSEIDYAALHRLLDVDRKAMKPDLVNSTSSLRYLSYPFKSLSVGGLAIGNPRILVNDRGNSERVCDDKEHYGGERNVYLYRCFGGGDMHLGLKQLRALRLFIAFSEKMLYITPADAH
jgi:hypothetical protein